MEIGLIIGVFIVIIVSMVFFAWFLCGVSEQQDKAINAMRDHQHWQDDEHERLRQRVAGNERRLETTIGEVAELAFLKEERMRQPKEYIKVAKRFNQYTGGLKLNAFMDWNLSIGLSRIQFDISKYIEWCGLNGMQDEESIAEFNIRKFGKENGEKLNELIQQLF